MSDDLGLASLIEPIARQLLGEPNARLSSADELRFGTHGSVSVKIAGEKAGTWFDFEAGAGGGVLDLVRTRKQVENGAALDWLRAEGFLPQQNGRSQTRESIATVYDYRAADGALLFQVVRKHPKKFLQRRPDGRGGWLWNLDGVQRVPYRLPELLEAPPETKIYLVEGEGDVEALRGLGLTATTNPGGAGKWLANMSGQLRDRDVVILPDNDPAGEQHAQDVATKLTGIARSVRIIRLPDLPPKGDVSDWLNAGHTAADLEELVRQASPGPAGPPRQQTLTVLTPADCETAQPRPYLVKGLLGRGDCVLLVGQPGAGKSALGPYLGYAVAQGRAVFGRRVRRGTVVYVAVEDGHGMQLRVRALRQRWGDAPDFHLVPQSVDLKDPNSWHLGALAELIQRLKPALVIVDTLARAFPGLKENEADSLDGMGRVVAVMRELAGLCDSAVMLIHHAPKEGASPRGHSALNGDADVAMLVEGMNGQARQVRLMKNRNGPSDATLTFHVSAQALGEDDDGDLITAAIAEEIETKPADRVKAKEASLRDQPLFMLQELRNLSITDAKPVLLEADGPSVSAVSRQRLREALIEKGWFSEDLLRTASDGKIQLERKAYPKENAALDSLKRRGFLAFNRKSVWLL